MWAFRLLTSSSMRVPYDEVHQHDVVYVQDPRIKFYNNNIKISIRARIRIILHLRPSIQLCQDLSLSFFRLTRKIARESRNIARTVDHPKLYQRFMTRSKLISRLGWGFMMLPLRWPLYRRFVPSLLLCLTFPLSRFDKSLFRPLNLNPTRH